MAIDDNVDSSEEAEKVNNALGDDFDDDFEQPSDTPTGEPAPVTEAPDPLDVEVPTDKLSGYYKLRAQQTGKPIRYRDLIEGADTAEQKIAKQGEEANRWRDEARAKQAMLEATQQLINELRGPKPAPRQPSYEDVGLSDPNEEILRDPTKFGQSTAHLGAKIATEQLTPTITALQQQIAALQSDASTMAIVSAAEQARQRLQIPLETWQERGRFLYAEASVDPRGPKSPDAWADAAERANKAWASPAPRVSIPQEGITRGNPMGSSRPTPVRAVAVKPRIRSIVLATEQEAIKNGMDPATARAISERTEAKLAAQEGRN